jgi:lactate racemase
MNPIGLLYGKGKRIATLPDTVELAIADPKSLPPILDMAAEIRRAMREPIGSQRLKELAAGRKEATILVCDLTRDVPDSVILPIILDELNEAGIGDSDIRAVVAGGGHRPITCKEAEERFGSSLLQRIEFVDHDAEDADSLVRIGTTSFGTPVWINRDVAESDLVLGTGCIIPHVIAGYGGGRKLIIPGVAGVETIRRNHRPENINHPGVGFCQLTGNVIHEELMEAARMARLDFIVNVVWAPDGDLVQVVAGDMEEAWQAGVETADAMYAVQVEHPVDLLITSGGGAPSDINFYQAVRGMQVGVPIVREGGAIVLVAECSDGVGSDPLHAWLRDASCPKDVLDRREREGFDIHGEHIACYLCERVFPYHPVFLVSSLPARHVEEMMMTPAASVDEAIELALEYLGDREVSVFVNPYGAKAVPRLKGGVRG